MSKYDKILESLAEGKDLIIGTPAAPTTVRAALYKQLKKLNESLKELGMSLNLKGIEVTQYGEGKLKITAKTNTAPEEIEILEEINRGELPNEEEL